MEKRVVEISLQGQRFTLRSDLDDQTLSCIVESANSRIDGIAASAAGLSPHKVALLAVLDLAEELYREKTCLTDLRERIRDKSNLLLDMLEGIRHQSAGGSAGDNPPGEG